jgi:4-aminobutyrate aminotransferase
MLILTCGTYENVIRWIPPLIVNSEQIDTALDIFADALAEVGETARVG